MDITVLVQSLIMVFTSCLSLIVGWLTAKYKSAKTKNENAAAEAESMKRACITLMGARLDALCDEYENSTDASAEQTQHLIDEWEIYHGCGGDGVRTARVERITGMTLEE